MSILNIFNSAPVAEPELSDGVDSQFNALIDLYPSRAIRRGFEVEMEEDGSKIEFATDAHGDSEGEISSPEDMASALAMRDEIGIIFPRLRTEIETADEYVTLTVYREAAPETQIIKPETGGVLNIFANGGPGSGNFGHGGRPGERGGSSPAGGGSFSEKPESKEQHAAQIDSLNKLKSDKSFISGAKESGFEVEVEGNRVTFLKRATSDAEGNEASESLMRSDIARKYPELTGRIKRENLKDEGYVAVSVTVPKLKLDEDAAPERDNLEVARTISQQLGGGKFRAMTGAKNFVGSKDSLSFRIPGGGGFAKDGINAIHVKLTPSDEYDMTFSRIAGGKSKTVHEVKGLHAEDLQRVFTEKTGLRTRLGNSEEAAVDLIANDGKERLRVAVEIGNPDKLANRFQLAPDGWVHLAPKGEHPHPAGLVQVIDDEAAADMVNSFNATKQANPNFTGVLLDFDHRSLNPEDSTEAGGWIDELQNRPDGLWGHVRWTESGEKAVVGGNYRLVSPVWKRSDCEELGANRVRPKVLDSVALTNQPNLKGLNPITK